MTALEPEVQRTDLVSEEQEEMFGELPVNCKEVAGKQSAAIAAEKAGFGNKETYRQAKTVTENATPELIEEGEIPDNYPELSGQESREIAAKKAGFGSEFTYRQAKTVTENATPELIEAMDKGDIAISTAAKLAVLSTTVLWIPA